MSKARETKTAAAARDSKSVTSKSDVTSESGWGVYADKQQAVKLQSNLRDGLIQHIYEPKAREYFVTKGKLTDHSFGLVNWQAIHRGLNGASSTFTEWATKHVTGFCATMRRQKVMNKHPTGLCPSCNEKIEYPKHLPVCTHKDIQNVYRKKVQDLAVWMEGVQTDPALSEVISNFLLTHGETTFILPANTVDLRPAGRLAEQATIGYDNFLMGMTANSLEHHQHAYYISIGSSRSAAVWASNLSRALLRISHACWLKRNRLLHGSSPEYLPSDAFAALNTKIVQEYRKGFADLPASDHKLLREGLTKTLERRTAEKQSWLYTVQLARDRAKAKKHN